MRGGKRLFKWLQLMWSINLLYALRPLQINFTPAACRLIMWQRAGDVPSPSGWKKRRTGGQAGGQADGPVCSRKDKMTGPKKPPKTIRSLI